MSEEVKEPRILNYLHAAAIKKKFPVSCNLELTPRCNMNCKMCYIRKSKAEMDAAGFRERTADEWISIGEQCRNAGTLFLLFTGGEPFLRKDFKEIYIRLHEMGFMISINTNGTLIDEKTAGWLKMYPPYRVNMTLYGASEETYARLCGDSSGFSRMMKAAHLIKEAGIDLKVNASMTPENIDDLEKMFEIAEDLQVPIQATSYMFPPIRKNPQLKGSGNRFSAEEAARYSVLIDKLQMSEKRYLAHLDGIHMGNTQGTSEDEYMRGPAEPLWCRAGRSTCWINWKGEMTPCGLMNYPIEYPFADGLLPAFRSLTEQTEKIRMPAKCTSCSKRYACHICGASAQAETGVFTEAPDYICKMTEKIILESEKEYLQLARDQEEDI